MGALIHYAFAGLRVASAFVLPGLLPADEAGASPDILVLLEDGPPPLGERVHAWRGHFALSLESCGEDWLVRSGPGAVIAISDRARTLRCYPSETDGLGSLPEILVRRILPRISSFFGRFPIHAATLSDGRGAIVLLGASGAGKSTMTAALAQRLGWTIFADDMSILADDDGVTAHPTAPGVSVWPASQAALALPPQECRPLPGYGGKAWFAPAAPDLTPRPVKAVIMLAEASGDRIETRRLSGPDVLVMLASQLVVFNPRDREHVEPWMARLTQILDGLTVYSLSYPRDFRRLPAVLEAIQGLRAEAPPAEPYDLILERHDFAAWTGPPRRSLLICSHPRSGSTLVGEAIRSAGGLGCPLEYLHRGFRPALAARWGAPELQGYVSALHRRRTESNGVLSIKLFWQDIEDVAHERAPGRFPEPGGSPLDATSEQDYRDLFTLVSDLLPHPEFVYLERQDRVRQAVSAIVATQTGLWRSIPGVGRQEAVAEPQYDYDRIAGMIAFADYSHGHWRRFFKVNALAPRHLTYEESSADFEGTAGRLCALLGSTSAPSARRMRRQANDTSEAMVLRFLKDHATRGDGFRRE